MSTDLTRALIDALQPAPIEHVASILEWKPFPAATYWFLVKTIGEHAIVVNQQAASDRQAGLRFLELTTAAHLDRVSTERPWSVAPLVEDRVLTFDVRAITHPSIGPSGLNKATAFLKGRLYQTYPLYECEFMPTDSIEDFRYRMTKFAQWADWSRTPQPALGLRLNFVKRGVRTTRGKGFIVAGIEETQRQVKNIEKDPGFIEIMNYRGDILRLEKQDEVSASLNGSPVAGDDRPAMVNAFALGKLNPLAATGSQR
jgi:hypothetical protein